MNQQFTLGYLLTILGKTAYVSIFKSSGNINIPDNYIFDGYLKDLKDQCIPHLNATVITITPSHLQKREGIRPALIIEIWETK